MTQDVVLITGGSGFIGSHLATALIERGERVRVLDNFATSAVRNLDQVRDHVEVIEGDLRDLEAVSRAMVGVDIVYHLGAALSVPESIVNPRYYVDTNITGTANVLQAAREASIRRVVFSSSSSIYGNTTVVPTPEHLLPNPISPYAISKLAGEHFCLMANDFQYFESVILRYFNVFGPRQDPFSPYAAVIPKFIHAVINGQKPLIYGDGEQTRGFTYVDDVVRGNLLAGRLPMAAGKVMNLSADSSITVNAVLEYICTVLDVPMNPQHYPPRPGDIRDSLADITLARKILGWQPETLVQDGIRMTAETYVMDHGGADV